MRAAVDILDEGGADALTFRALASRLSTGAGAIYHHVANKSDLLAAAADEVVDAALGASATDGSEPRVRGVMLRLYDAIGAHPWLGTQLAAAPWQRAVLRLFDRIGSELDELGVPENAQFDAASALVYHLLGVASQYDAGTRLPDVAVSRPAFLESAVSDLLRTGGPSRYPFITRVTQQFTAHDDRDQFGSGVEIILAGIATL